MPDQRRQQGAVAVDGIPSRLKPAASAGSSASAPEWSKWVFGASRESSARTKCRLFCFPHAGGTGSDYRKWPAEFPPEIEVLPIQLPGRGNRWNEPPIERMTVLVESLASALVPRLDLPFAFFGHSMGCFVAYELAHFLYRNYGAGPVSLFASGARAPHLADPEPSASALPDSAFLEKMKMLNGFPPELRNNDEFLRMILPFLRADIGICDHYRIAPGMPLPCPITALGGRDDRRVTGVHLAAWMVHTESRFRIRFFPGDHFFIGPARRQVTRVIADEVLELLAAARSL